MDSIVPATPELIRAAFELLSDRAEYDIAFDDTTKYLSPGSEYNLQRQQAFVVLMRSRIQSTRLRLAQCLVEAMRSTNHNGTWIGTFMLDEIGGQWLLISQDRGRLVYASPETWAKILETATHLTARELKMSVANEDDWHTLEAHLPLLLGHISSREILNRQEETLATLNS